MICKRKGCRGKAKGARRCLTPQCLRPVKHRGLCGACYQAARRAVAAEKTTWERLEAMGLAGPVPQAPMVKAIVAAERSEGRKAGA